MVTLVDYKGDTYLLHLNTIARMFEAKRRDESLMRVSCKDVSIDRFYGYVTSSPITIHELVSNFPLFMDSLSPLTAEEIKGYQIKIAQQRQMFNNFL